MDWEGEYRRKSFEYDQLMRSYQQIVAERDDFVQQLAQLRGKLRERHDFSDFREPAELGNGVDRLRT